MAGTVAQSMKVAAKRARYFFRRATAADDEDIRRMLRETPMDGPVRITLRREPNYFQAASLEGRHHETLVAVDSGSDRLVGMASRSFRQRYVDGEPMRIGYLSGLRIRPEHRRGTLLARGYRKLRDMHRANPAEIYLTTIAEGNEQALASLTKQRAGLPTYHPLGKYHTFLIPLRRFGPAKRNKQVEIRPLQTAEIPLLVEFLNRVGKGTQFFPCYDAGDFAGPQATFKGLQPEHILTAWRGTKLVGSLALWDQSQFKQTVVEEYGSVTRWTRPFYNAFARLTGWPRLPAPREPLHALVGAIPVVAPDEVQLFGNLLGAASVHARSRFPDCRSLLVGAYERDPIRKHCQSASLVQYVTQVFGVTWDQPDDVPARFRNRNLYLELGCL